MIAVLSPISREHKATQLVARTHQRNARSANLSAPPLMRVQMYNKVILDLKKKKKGKHYFMRVLHTS